MKKAFIDFVLFTFLLDIDGNVHKNFSRIFGSLIVKKKS